MCNEFCGDGLNYGQHECDDGNNIDGDGCSKNCNLEEGYACEGTSCRDITSPIAKLSYHSLEDGKFHLVVSFSEEMMILDNIERITAVTLDNEVQYFDHSLHESSIVIGFNPYDLTIEPY
jgi:cysteine-rich repeat protein